MTPQRFDAVLVGAGLHSALIALALFEHHPDTRVAIVERNAEVGGEHTWCCHADDVPAAARAFVEPLIEHRWNGYDVLFPDLSRRIEGRYAGLSSRQLRDVLQAAFDQAPHSGDRRIFTGTEVTAVHADRVVCADGTAIHGRLVIDTRGDSNGQRDGTGYQVFLGQELRLDAPHGLTRPVLMDANVEQRGGYRFVYVLPLAADRVLVEDTRFADTATLPRDELRRGVRDYCSARGWTVSAELREEVGVLAMPWRGTRTRIDHGPLRAGYAGGFMHPATGYSFPVAVRFAALIGRLGVDGCFDGAQQFGSELRTFANRHNRQLRFAQLLNRLLFRWFDPTRRVDVFRRFYRLPESRIRRFYALQTTVTDRIRLLVGKPPRGFSLRARLQSRRPSHDLVRV